MIWAATLSIARFASCGSTGPRSDTPQPSPTSAVRPRTPGEASLPKRPTLRTAGPRALSALLRPPCGSAARRRVPRRGIRGPRAASGRHPARDATACRFPAAKRSAARHRRRQSRPASCRNRDPATGPRRRYDFSDAIRFASTACPSRFGSEEPLMPPLAKELHELADPLFVVPAGDERGVGSVDDDAIGQPDRRHQMVSPSSRRCSRRCRRRRICPDTVFPAASVPRRRARACQLPTSSHSKGASSTQTLSARSRTA